MDVGAKLAEAKITRVAIVDDDLSKAITVADLDAVNEHMAALLNDATDPDRQKYVALLDERKLDRSTVEALAAALSDDEIRAAAPERIKAVADAVLAERSDRAASVQLIAKLLERHHVATIDTYGTTDVPAEKFYDLVIVDYFLVDTSKDRTIPFIRELVERHRNQTLPLQIILMSSHHAQLLADFKTIRPELKVSSARLRIMGKPADDKSLFAWRVALYQLSSDRNSLLALENFVQATGDALVDAAKKTAIKLWELDLQAVDLLHELASKDNDDFTRYVEDAVSRRLLSELEAGAAMRPSLRVLDNVFTQNRHENLLSPTAEIGDSRAAIRGFMHSMEWRAIPVDAPTFPTTASEIERARWIRKYVRFGMVLRDNFNTEWLNITQACDMAQTEDSDINNSSILLVRGQRTIPTESPKSDYFVLMQAMMAQTENHVLLWNLRDYRAESIQTFSTAFAGGWQIAGELRPEVAQDIAARFGARAARVGLPVTLSTWRLSGRAVRAGDLTTANEGTALNGTSVSGYAIERAAGKGHELHLDPPSLEELIDAHGEDFDDSVLRLYAGIQVKKGKKIEGKPLILYCENAPQNVGDLRRHLDHDAWLKKSTNADRIVVALWCAL